MSEKSILIVDDHQEIRDLLASYLQQHGYLTVSAANGEQMRAAMSEQTFDLIVLDLMMPGEDGLSLCRHVRSVGGPPVIMLTAMSEEADTIVGLEMGADDYVTKPFTPRVLLARIKAVLRRARTEEPASPERDDDNVRFDSWLFERGQRQLVAEDGLVIPLSQTEFKLLEVFVDHPQKVLSRDQLLTLTKGREADPFDRTIDNQVSRLRKKLETDPQNPQLIKTVWGGGYLFCGQLSP